MLVSTVKIRRTKADKNPIAVLYEFGDTVEQSISKFDGKSPLDKVVHGLFVTAAKQQLQDYVRSLITVRKPKVKKGKKNAPAPVDSETLRGPLTLEEIQAKVDVWKPTVERAAKRVVEKAKKVVDNLSAEERRALLQRLQAEVPQEIEGDVREPRRSVHMGTVEA